MSEESPENVTKSDSNFALTFVDHHLLPDMNFNGHCLIKSNTSIPKKVINPYICHTLCPQLRNLNTDFTLGTQPANIVPQDVPRTPLSKSPGRPLKILFDHPGDVPI